MVKLNKPKTRLLVLDVSLIQSTTMSAEYGQYRFLTFCDESSKLLTNYVQTAFDTSLENHKKKDVKSYSGDWWTGVVVKNLDRHQLEMIFDKVTILFLEDGNYDDNYYAKPPNGGYIGWINDEVDLDGFFED